LPWCLCQEYLKKHRARCSPPLLGFITGFEQPGWSLVRFVAIPGLVPSLAKEAEDVEEAFIDASIVCPYQDDPVLFRRDGEMVVREDSHGGRYARRGVFDAHTPAIFTPPEILEPASGGNPEGTTASFVVLEKGIALFQDSPRLTGTSTAAIAPAKLFELSSLTQEAPQNAMDSSTKVRAEKERLI
jgi:hypothetical protein